MSKGRRGFRIDRVRAACEAAGVRFVRCNAKHWQLRTRHFIVNYWPTAARVHVAGTEHSVGAPETIDDLVTLALEGPPRGRLTKRKSSMTKEKHRLYQKDPRCHWCKEKLQAREATVDHRIPLARGGTNRRDNLVLACETCNRRRADQMPEVRRRA